MYSLRLRVLLILASLILGVVALVRGPARAGVLFLTAAAALIYGHYRYGTIWLAFRAYRRGEVERAASLLAQMRPTALLRKRDLAYYHFLRGAIAEQRGEGSVAAGAYANAVQGPRCPPDLRNLSVLRLAHLAADRNDDEGAREYIARIRKDRPHDDLLRALAELESRLPTASRSP